MIFTAIRKILPHSILLISLEYGTSLMDLILPIIILIISILWIRKLKYDKIEI